MHNVLDSCRWRVLKTSCSEVLSLKKIYIKNLPSEILPNAHIVFIFSCKVTYHPISSVLEKLGCVWKVKQWNKVYD